MEIINSSTLYDLVNISGGKGGGGGGHTPTEASDTLASVQTLKLLVCVGEGPIHSITDILLNKVSISNFPDVTYEFRNGTASQTAISGFTNVESTLGGFAVTELAFGNTPGKPSVAFSASIPHDTDAVRVTLGTDKLLSVTSGGDRVGYSLSYSISTKETSGAIPVAAVTQTKSGKGDNIAWDTIINRPAGNLAGNWEILIEKTSPDDATDQTYSNLFVRNLTTIIYRTETYPNTAVIGLTIKNAAQFGGSEPTVTIIPKGMMFYLPTGYDATTRAYPTTWDLTFKNFVEYTDNLSWAIYYSLVNTRWGRKIPAAYINVGSFYNFAKFCDELVDDGNGGLEPRFRVDYCYISRSDASTYFAKLCAIGNAQLIPNIYGQIEIMWDGANQSVSHIESNATVENGDFSYATARLEDQINHITCTFSNSELLGDSDIIPWVETALVTQNGLIPKDLLIEGVTRKSQVLRKAKWAVWTNSKDIYTIQFKKFFAGLAYQKGQKIKVLDSYSLYENSLHACVLSSAIVGANTSIVLDRSIILANEAYTVDLLLADTTLALNTTVFQTNGTFSTITVVGNHTCFVGGTILFSGTSIKAQTYKVVAVEKDEDVPFFTISAVQYSEERHAYIDQIGTFLTPDPSGDFVNYTNLTIEPVTNITFQQSFSSSTAGDIAKILVAWTWNLSYSAKFQPTFNITYSREGTPSTTIRNIVGTSFDILRPLPGVYSVAIWATNPVSGLSSAALAASYNYRVSAATSTLIAPINVYSAGTTGTSFQGKDLVISWESPIANLTKTDKLKDFLVEVKSFGDTVVKGKFANILPTSEGVGRITISLESNIALFGTATAKFDIYVYCRDLVGDYSSPAVVTFENPAPTLAALGTINALEAAILTATLPAETDVVSYVFRKYAAISGGTALEIIESSSNIAQFPATVGVQYWYTASAKDYYREGPEAPRSAGTAFAASADNYTYDGLIFTPNSPSANSVSWTAFTAYKNGILSANVTAADAAWTSTPVYLYFTDGDTTLNITSDITVAVSGHILAIYRGGTNLSHDAGKAFIDGSDIIANTLTGNKLVTDTAVITTTAQIQSALIAETHIGTAAINNAAIKDYIQSQSYNATTHEGWKLDKNGDFSTYGKLKIGTQNVGVGTATSTFVPGALTLNNGGSGASLNNSIIKKLGATAAFDEQGYSSQSYSGTCSCFFSFAQTTMLAAAGLTTDPTADANYTSLDYCFYTTAAGLLQIFENGTIKGTNYGTFSVDDIFEIRYSGTTINYLKNGVSLATTTVAAGQTLFFDSSIYTQNAVIDQIKFGQYQTVTPDYGARMEITGNILKVYDRNNVLRVKLGDLNG